MDWFSLFNDVTIGLGTALQPVNLIYCFVGVFLGMVVGVLPGFGIVTAMSLLMPLTFYLDPATGVIMLAGIYYGSAYGGSTAAILINVPGSASSAVVSFDGYPLAQQGKAGVALLVVALSSFVGGSIGIICMMLFSPIIAAFAYQFGPPEYFALMVLGLVAASTISKGSPLKGLSMVCIGVVFGFAGMDIYTGEARFSLGLNSIAFDGIGIMVFAMGIFGVSEVISSVNDAGQHGMTTKKVTFRSMVPDADDRKRFWFPTLRGTAIGAFFGTLPGTGPTIASIIAYAVEKRVAKQPSRFGRGAIEGIISPEAANNAADQTSFIPTLTLGVPGSPVMALILGVFMLHNIVPGPTFMAEKPDIFWGLIMSFWIGNIMLLILNIPLIGLWVRMLQVPYHILYPAIVIFICLGVYTVNNSPEDVLFVAAFGTMGYVMRLLDFPTAPMLLGFILGPLIEEHFRRAMMISGGDFPALFRTPVALTVSMLTLALLAWSAWSMIRSRARMLDGVAEEI